MTTSEDAKRRHRQRTIEALWYAVDAAADLCMEGDDGPWLAGFSAYGRVVHAIFVGNDGRLIRRDIDTHDIGSAKTPDSVIETIVDDAFSALSVEYP